MVVEMEMVIADAVAMEGNDGTNKVVVVRRRNVKIEVIVLAGIGGHGNEQWFL